MHNEAAIRCLIALSAARVAPIRGSRKKIVDVHPPLFLVLCIYHAGVSVYPVPQVHSTAVWPGSSVDVQPGNPAARRIPRNHVSYRTPVPEN